MKTWIIPQNSYVGPEGTFLKGVRQQVAGPVAKKLRKAGKLKYKKVPAPQDARIDKALVKLTQLQEQLAVVDNVLAKDFEGRKLLLKQKAELVEFVDKLSKCKKKSKLLALLQRKAEYQIEVCNIDIELRQIDIDESQRVRDGLAGQIEKLKPGKADVKVEDHDADGQTKTEEATPVEAEADADTKE